MRPVVARRRTSHSLLGTVLALLALVGLFGALSPATPARAAGIITGTVFNDYNDNGVQDTSKTLANVGSGTMRAAVDTGIGGVVVTAYDAAGTARGSTTTGTNGTYSLSATGTGPYRIEFTSLPTGYQPGSAGGTTVQFVPDGNSSNINLGLVRPADYCQNNPDLVTSCYTFDGSSTNASRPTLISFPYNAGSSDTSTGTDATIAGLWDPPATHTLGIPASQIGATWGLAYRRGTGMVYAAAFLKKHTAFGPGGTGAIYQVNPATNTASVYADLNAILGAGTAGTNPHNTANYTSDNGNTTWGLVGKSSLGGMAASDDGTRLYVMNLTNRSLYELPLDAAPTAANIRSSVVPLTPPGCPASSDVRPFAVHYYQGQLFIGLVCSGESTSTVDTFTDSNSNGLYDSSEAFVDNDGNGVYNAGDARALKAYVYTADTSGPAITFSAAPVFQTDLNYTRRCADNVGTGHPGCPSATWNTWVSTFTRLRFGPGTALIYPQPVLTDIAFDNGNLVLGIRDRVGDQGGNNMPSNPSSPATLYYAPSIGDTIRACGSLASGWTLESNARCGGQGSGTQGNGQGPGNGEYYYVDGYIYHDDTNLGGLAQVPGFPEVVTTVFDPHPSQSGAFVWDGGVRWYTNSTGNIGKGYRVYDAWPGDGVTFSKANGLGDLIVLCDEAPIEIGNRVWNDTDGDGVQDPGEPAIDGVTVRLYDAANTLIATALTDANGNYVFSSDPRGYPAGGNSAPNNTASNGGFVENNQGGRASTASSRYGLPIDPSSSYTVRLNNAADYAGGPLAGLQPTVAAADSGADSAIRDSDGVPSSTTDVRASVTTGTAGANDHSFDFGFAPVVSLGNLIFEDFDDDGSFTVGVDAPIQGAQVGLYAADGVTPATDLSGTTVATQTTGADGLYLFDQLKPGSYVVRVVGPAGYVSSTDIATTLAPNGDLDGDDNGLGMLQTVASASVTLTFGGEPTSDGDADSSSNLSLDFGFWRPAAIGDLVWLDRDGDGVRDVGEPGVPNVTVTLHDVEGFDIDSTLTDSGGFYSFPHLPAGDYRVSFTLPSGYVFSPAGRGGNPDADSDADPTKGNTAVTTLDPGEADSSWDAGIFQPVSLGNLVWEDADNDGRVDAGEAGMGGVSVRLFADANVDGAPDSTTPIATTTTDAGGRYSFTQLVPGSYLVEISPPAGYTTSTGTSGAATGAYEPAPAPNGDIDGDDNGSLGAGVIRSGAVTLWSQGEPAAAADGDGPNGNMSVDFGLFRPAAVGSVVWYDRDGDGRKDADEAGVPGVTVTLYHSDGTPVRDGTGQPITVITDANGQYLFDNLAPGDYRVGFGTLPSGYTFTAPGVGDDSADSDVDPNTGLSVPVSLTAGNRTLNLWAGLINPTAIALTSFTAERQGEGVALRWTTGAEWDTWGFHLYRSADGSRAGAVQVTPRLILAQGGPQLGASYTWQDTTVTPGVSYSYWLYEVELSGGTREYGPVTLTARTADSLFRVFVPVVVK